MLEIDELRVNYGRVPALHGISLRVDEGEAVAMIGPNGAGKTTTLSAIFGLVAPAGGTILFEGESLVGASPEKILRRGLALVPEGRRRIQEERSPAWTTTWDPSPAATRSEARRPIAAAASGPTFPPTPRLHFM